MALGVSFIIVGVIMGVRRAVTRQSSAIDMLQYNVPLSQRQVQKNAPSADDLVAKLRKLEEAYDARLISQEEYDRLRQKILDEGV